MRELEPEVLVALEALEESPALAWDEDLRVFREFMEGSLRGPVNARILSRFVSDAEFVRLTMPVMLARIKAMHGVDEKEELEWERQSEERRALWAEEDQREHDRRARRRALMTAPLRMLALVAERLRRRDSARTPSSPASRR
jgi:hypothetical protein